MPTFTVHLAPGNKTQTAAQVRSDMGEIKSGVVFNTERESTLLLNAVSAGLGDGWTRVLQNECTFAYGSHFKAAGKPTALLLAKDDPHLSGVSKNRYLNRIPTEHVDLADVTIVHKGSHWVSEANNTNTKVKGRVWREKTYKIQLADSIASLKRDHTAGNPQVFALDANTGVHFTGDQLFAALKKVFGADVVHAHNGFLDHIFLISTPKVRLTAGKPVKTKNTSDHDMVSVAVTATLVVAAQPTTPPVVVAPPAPTTPATPVTPAPPITDKLIRILKAEVGYREGKSGSSWNNKEKYAAQVKGLEWANGQPWCATFASWAYTKAGLRPNVDFPVTASCDAAGAWYKKQGRWSEYPAIGAQALYGSPADLNHTGIVIAFDGTNITVVEGNTNDNGSREGDGVYTKIRKRRATSVVGYGYPKFPLGIVSADPRWAKGKTAAATSHALHPDGIDLSHWNDERIDWAKAKAAGVRFAWHKATEHTAMRDELYAPRRAEIHNAGVLFGGYHFARPAKSSGLVQARFHLAVAKPKPGEGRVMLDLEDRGRLDIDGLDAWVEDFVDEVMREVGTHPIIYTKYDLRSRHGCMLWTARYNDDNEAPPVAAPWQTWDIDQFSNGVEGTPHTVPGVPMKVDINRLRTGLDLTDLKIAS